MSRKKPKPNKNTRQNLTKVKPGKGVKFTPSWSRLWVRRGHRFRTVPVQNGAGSPTGVQVHGAAANPRRAAASAPRCEPAGSPVAVAASQLGANGRVRTQLQLADCTAPTSNREIPQNPCSAHPKIRLVQPCSTGQRSVPDVCSLLSCPSVIQQPCPVCSASF